MRCDVVVAGEYYCDLIFSGLSASPRLGEEIFARGLAVRPGGCYNMALGLVRLGVSTCWACDFGTDQFSRLVLEAARNEGIDGSAFRHFDRSLQQVSVAFSDAQERGFITFREGVLAAPAPELLSGLSPAWLLQSFRCAPDWIDFMRAARAAGIKIFGDCNGDAASLNFADVSTFVSLCDVFSPNEAEALALTGAAQLDDALARLAELCPAVIVKRGPLGATAIIDGHRYDEVAPEVEVVDTVGAGDAFAAGFLAAVLDGQPIQQRLRRAVACGAMSTTGPGSSANPTATELRAFMARQEKTQPYAASA